VVFYDHYLIVLRSEQKNIYGKKESTRCQQGNSAAPGDNVEQQTKVADLSRANNDMNNLLAGTGIGAIFVDHQPRIQRFTGQNDIE
jgi:two-component system, chemotaxis family, CheB/CheR fusion protein